MITVIKDVREKYHEGFERIEKDENGNRAKAEINEIVFHKTRGQTASGLVKWMMGGERADLYYKGVALFHYIIDGRGKICELIDPNNGVYHSSSGQHDMHTIGIEFTYTRDKKGKEIFTVEQYEAAKHLVFDVLMEKYYIDSIVGHGYNRLKYSKIYKDCPGTNFDWGIFTHELNDRGYIFDQEPEKISILKDLTLS